MMAATLPPGASTMLSSGSVHAQPSGVIACRPICRAASPSLDRDQAGAPGQDRANSESRPDHCAVVATAR